jgi:hypothetical protein
MNGCVPVSVSVSGGSGLDAPAFIPVLGHDVVHPAINMDRGVLDEEEEIWLGGYCNSSS